MNENILLASVIKQAVEDYQNFKRNPKKYDDNGNTRPQFGHFMSAERFLFRDRRLENFIHTFHLDLSSDYIRRRTKNW